MGSKSIELYMLATLIFDDKSLVVDVTCWLLAWLLQLEHDFVALFNLDCVAVIDGFSAIGYGWTRWFDLMFDFSCAPVFQIIGIGITATGSTAFEGASMNGFADSLRAIMLLLCWYISNIIILNNKIIVPYTCCKVMANHTLTGNLKSFRKKAHVLRKFYQHRLERFSF